MHRLNLIILFWFAFPVFAQIPELPDFTDLIDTQGVAVVNISTVQTHISSRHQMIPGIPNIPLDSPFYEFFRRYSPNVPISKEPLPHAALREFESKSLGSGFIISDDGYTLTNAHVMNSADEITVRLNDKREFQAKIIGVDHKTDIALLKIEASSLPKVTQGDPNQLRVGE